MGIQNSIAKMREEYKSLKNIPKSIKTFTGKKRNEMNTDIDKILKNPSENMVIVNKECKDRRFSAETIKSNSLDKSSVTDKSSETQKKRVATYKKQEKRIPLHKFFLLFFHNHKIEVKRKKKRKINRTMSKRTESIAEIENEENSDTNFSDLESLKYNKNPDKINNKLIYEFKEFIIPKQEINFHRSKSSEQLIKHFNESERESISDYFFGSEVEISLNIRIKNSSSTVSTVSKIYKNDINDDDYKKKIDTHSNTRTKYITKLSLNNNFPTGVSSQIEVNSFFIYDWDDTFLPTSYLTSLDEYKNTGKIIIKDKDNKNLKNLEDIIVNILEYSIQNGNTYIVTNAEKGWVEYTAKIFYPRVEDLLRKICVISARGEYESLYPTETKIWKTRTFLNLTKVFNVNALTNIICLGDSIIEIYASQVLAKKFKNSFLKSIKFMENPKPEDLIKELKLLDNIMNRIYSENNNLTINAEIKPKSKFEKKK